MIRLLLLHCCLFCTTMIWAGTIIVKNAEELKEANKKARPGDIILLQNGEWKDVTIKLDCNGNAAQPITFKAQIPGKVRITGHSQLRLGGSFIIVEGLYFTGGYAGKDPVISFRTDSKQVASNCRVTNSAIHDFNNSSRMDENYWVAFYGKNNRLDHCSFTDKKNIGVLLAVILDDDRSRENFHSIDHNYFGRRAPLASNGGEIIRVGVSQHCEFNSNTQITDNFFEYCDGETEIVSIKSGSNIVRGNLFKESQGSVVLRHGNYNTVENNIFLGNDKEGTGGVRVINKGQWVVNNFFYKCRGVDFRSPLAVMNGIPNSPANRYVQVTDAVIANNTFVGCTPASFGEGSDAERTLPPANVIMSNNIFYNTRDSIIYKIFDDIKGISFWGNEVNAMFKQPLLPGFAKVSFTLQKSGSTFLPVTMTKGAVALPDSIQKIAQERLQHTLSTRPGFAGLSLLKKMEENTRSTGAAWLKQESTVKKSSPLQVNCETAEEVHLQLEKKEPVTIMLTGSSYTLTKPFVINKQVKFNRNINTGIAIVSGNMHAVFIIAGNGHLTLQNLDIAGEKVQASHFITSEKNGSSDHYNLVINNCRIRGLSRLNGCQSLFYAYKSMVADSIVIRRCSFGNNNTDGIVLAEERDDKGYYNSEKIVLVHNTFRSQTGSLLRIYRGGNDESTLGPSLVFTSNEVSNCSTPADEPLIQLFGVQRSLLESNVFTNCNPGKILIRFEDVVRAVHSLWANQFLKSGKVVENKHVESKNNRSD